MLPKAAGQALKQHSGCMINGLAWSLSNLDLRLSNHWCQPCVGVAPNQQLGTTCCTYDLPSGTSAAVSVGPITVTRSTVTRSASHQVPSIRWGLLAGSSSSSSSVNRIHNSGWLQQPPHYQLPFTRGMAFKKAGGTARQNPDTPSRNLGVRFLHNELVFPGHIILTQRGLRYRPGENVGLGRNQTIFAKRVGRVQFREMKFTLFNGKSKTRTLVSVAPLEDVKEEFKHQHYKQLEADMIQRRAVIKRQLLANQAHEAALFFPLPADRAQPQNGR